MKKPIYLVMILLAFFACKKDDPVVEEPDYNITSDYYFAATIDGEKVVFQDGIDGYYNGYGDGGGTTPSGVQQNLSMDFLKPFLEGSNAGVMLLKSFSDWPTACTQLDGMFHTGSYNYGIFSISTEMNGTDGAMVYYTDPDGVFWTSDRSPGTQDGSSFEITEYVDYSKGTTSKVMKAKFNCILYNAIGQSKKLTNGEIRSVCLDCSDYVK